ncbi:MAG: histidine phosphatase family protein [Acidobacteria bacterium]|nr:histidine phosphatase family protein [Acidobacteriota bacterium]
MLILYETHATSVDNEAGLASGHHDADLSRAGEAQAAEMGERYRDLAVQAVYCSDLRRSWRTGEIAFGARGVPVMRDVRLRECDYGELTRRPSQELDEIRLQCIDRRFPGGESYRQVAARTADWLAAVAGGRGPVLVIGHRATWYALEHLLGGATLEEVLKRPWKWQPGWRYLLDMLKT